MRLTDLLFMVVMVALFVPLLIAREAGVLSPGAVVFALEREFPGRAADLRRLPPFREWKTITLGELIERCARELGFKGSQAPT
jgi:hypothetical protein